MQIIDVTDRKAQIEKYLSTLGKLTTERSTVRGHLEHRKWQVTNPRPITVFPIGFMLDVTLKIDSEEERGCGPISGYARGSLHIGEVSIPKEIMRYARPVVFDRDDTCFIDRESNKEIRTPAGLILLNNLRSLYLP